MPKMHVYMYARMSICNSTAEDETGCLASDGVPAISFPQKLAVELVANLKVVIRTADLETAAKPGLLTVYICLCNCSYTHSYTCAYIYPCLYTCPYACSCTCTCTHEHTCLDTVKPGLLPISTCLCTCLHTCLLAGVDVPTQRVYTYVYTPIRMQELMLSTQKCLDMSMSMRMTAHSCQCASLAVYKHVYTHVYACLRTCLCTQVSMCLLSSTGDRTEVVRFSNADRKTGCTFKRGAVDEVDIRSTHISIHMSARMSICMSTRMCT